MGSSPLPVSLQSKFNSLPVVYRLKSFRTNLSLLRNIIFILFLLRWTRKSFYFIRGHGLFGSIFLTYDYLYKSAYKVFLRLPGISSQVEKQVSTAIQDLESKLAPVHPGTTRHLTLPKEPWTKEQMTAELSTLANIKRTMWEDGKVSGAVYHGEDELLEVQAEAMKIWSVANPIHPDVFPAVRKMEAEIVAMSLALFHAPPDGGGVTTSGGTESILMACLAARQKAYTERSVTEPEMIVPSTAHAAFHKAAQYFKIKLHLISCPRPTYRVSLPSIRRLITPNTILLVGSAPNYPHGVMDDIPSLSHLALSHKISLHIDCCLGSFLLPFLSQAGFPPPCLFDFALPGVSSISVDTHKYGFAPKGNSVILYRIKSMRRYQYFISPDWSGGVYGSPSIAGSRPGALIAGCWVSLIMVGEKGYLDATHKIVGARITIQNAINEHPVLKSCLSVIGEPAVSVVAFQSSDPEIDIYDVSDGMSARGWHLNAGQGPAMVHVAVTLPMCRDGVIDGLITDLVQVVEEEKAKAVERVKAGAGERKRGEASALYGVAGKIPDKSVVGRLVVGYMDTLYKA